MNNQHRTPQKDNTSRDAGNDRSKSKHDQDEQSRKAPGHQSGDAKRGHDSRHDEKKTGQESHERGHGQSGKGENR